MRTIIVSIKQFRELQRLVKEMGNCTLVGKGELECYSDETKVKWDSETVTLTLTSDVAE